MFKATKPEFRVGSESVGLPDYGVHVLACTVHKKSFPSDALVTAYKAAYPNMGLVTIGELQRAHAEQGGLPSEVLAQLSKAGLKQEYTVGPLVEMYRVAPEDRTRRQQTTKDGWACDLMPLTSAWGTEPTHYTDLPKPFAP